MVSQKQPALRLVKAEAGTHVGVTASQNELVALIGRIGEHSEAALASFYDATVEQIYGLAARILGRGPDAEEITEDVYLYVWHNHERYEADKGHPLAWLLTLTRSRAIDRYRYRAKHDRLESALATAPSQEDGTPDLLNLYYGTRLHRCIEALPPVQRQILTLAYFRGLTHSEIADALELSLGTVKTHIRRTLIALRTVMDA